jgi:hypothetical protein
MLIYDPTLDPFHSAVRLLATLERSSGPAIEFDLARIADYYLAYPAKIASVRLPSANRAIKAAAKQLENPYRNPLEGKTTFDRMHPILLAASSCLAAAELVDASLLKTGRIQRTERQVPEALTTAVNNFLLRSTVVREFILMKLILIPLLGKDGLKDRTGLLEYRYDPV